MVRFRRKSNNLAHKTPFRAFIQGRNRHRWHCVRHVGAVHDALGGNNNFAPLFVVLLSYPVLKEPVGAYRLGAVLIGFTGVIIMANPTAETNTLPMLGLIVGLSWGFFAGCVDTCLRWMGKTENATTTVFYFVLFGTITCGMHFPFAEVKPDSFSLNAFWIIAGLGTTGLLSLLAKTQSFRLAEASLIAPIMYSMIIWTMLFDYLFWDKMPSMNVVLGASIIISSNIFILYRETAIKKKSI
ncbi:MAG: hypothetical protein COB36_08840 [Alphaproteobacteria bacterium]|nr:MAG: hypothetical protein COB36_08840 [Alphaproteobacteria bacterium]